MKTLVALFIIFFLFTSSNTQAKDSARFSVGVGVFNYMEDGSPPHNDQSGMINLELHTRFHRPIFCFVAALLGFSCILVGSHTKFGLGKQISLAIVTVIFIKIIESYTTKIAVSTHLLWPVIYTPSLVGILTNLLLLKISSAKLKLNWRLEK